MNEEKTQQTKFKVLHGHVSFETAKIVDNYPYGRLRTQMAYWIEYNKTHGYRLVRRSLNPKNGRWNNPKKDNYNAFLVLALNTENNHVIDIGFSKYSEEKRIQEFLDKYKDQFNENQIKYIESIIKVKTKVSEHFENVMTEIKETPLIPVSEIPSDKLLTSKDYVNADDDMDLIKISMSGYGIKKRCRKSDFHSLTIGYVKKDDREIDIFTASELIKKFKDTIKEKYESYFKEGEKIKVTIKKTTFKARKGESLFTGMQESFGFGNNPNGFYYKDIDMLK